MRKKMDEEQREIIKSKILDSTKTIIESEGFDAVSIRKVAKLAGYTEGNIYNYFDDKDSLVIELVQQGFQRIMKATMAQIEEGLSLEEQIIQRFIRYTKAAIEMPEYYKKMMLSENAKILEVTSVLNDKTKEGKKGIDMLENMIKNGVDTGEFIDEDPALIAKIIWTANFGLTLRLIVEKKSDEKEIVKLVENQLKLIFKGLRMVG